jgi:hypothetical protein
VAASTIGLTFDELCRWVGREVGVERDADDWSSISETDMLDIIKAGLRQFYWPPNAHIWSFLQPTEDEIEIYGPYEEGTVEVESDAGGSIVTNTGGTWPTWAADAELIVDGEWYSVEGRTSDSVITLDAIDVDVDAESSYTLVKRKYSLPSDFGGMLDPFTFRPGDPRYGLVKLNEAHIRSLEQGTAIRGEPKYFCIPSVAPTSTQESKAEAMFYPLPPNDATYKVWYRYTVVPPMLDGTTNVYAHGSAEYSETLLLSCLDKAMQTLYASDEKHAAFLESLAGATRRDTRKSRPHTYGSGSHSDGYGVRARLDSRRHRGDATIDVSDL